MAGTSPDRSKRYESSTGSTSGNEPPVPAAPSPGTTGSRPDQSSGPTGRAVDPRVSMSRDSSPRDAASREAASREAAPRVDQATAVFSRRALLEAAEAEGLKLEELEAEAAEEAATTGAATPSGREAVGSEASGSEAVGSEGAGSGAARSEADGSEVAGPEVAGSEVPKPRTDEPEAAEPATGRADAADVGGSEAARSDTAGSDTDSDDGEGPGEAGEPESGSGGRAETPTDAEDEPGSDDSDDDDEAVVTEPEAGAPEAGAEDEDADPRVRGAAAPTRAAPAARLPAAGTGADTEGDAEAQGDGDPESARKSEAHDDAEPDVEPEAEADAEPEAEPEAEAEAEPEAEAEAEPEADRKPEADAGLKVATASGSVADIGDIADIASEGDEPVAADGEDVPQGPPAGDAESPAGREPEGDGGAEAAVDQPTSIFRAPRVPAGDQPTTMLKLGGGATKPTDADERDADADERDADADADERDDITDAHADRDDITDAHADRDDITDAHADRDDDDIAAPSPAERTSKFVALKPLGEPAAPAPPALSPAEATRAIPQVGPECTTQQPLPPKPPLDLLAELTNTPPPRQTPVRTIIRKVKIWTPLAIVLAIVFAVVQTLRPLPTPTLALTADESYAFKGEKVSLPWPDEGQGWMDVNGIGTIDSFGEQKPVAIGSVAKAMTAYVILKDHPMKAGGKGETIPVDAKAETEGGYDKDGESTLNTVKEGDTLSEYDAIAAIMIPSANNIARLLARWDSNGSEKEFVKKMNAAAKDLGMTNTTYTDPSGLMESTVSTSEDQVKLGNALVRMKALTDITRLPYWHDPSGQRWDNYNRLVPYDNAIGIKTGSTTAAGGNLLFAATQEVGGETAIVVGAILGQHTPPIIDTVNAVSKTAMLASQEALTSTTILRKGDVVGYVDDGLGGQTPVMVTEDVSAVGWAGKTVKLELDANASIPHEATPGTEVGSLIVGDGLGDGGVEVPVAVQKDLTEPGFVPKLIRVA